MRRGTAWAATFIFVLALVVWGYATIRDTVPEGLVMGEQAPDATLVDLDGNPVRLSDFYGQPLIVRFSSRTCAFCYDDFGFLEQVQQHYGDDLQVVAVEFNAPPELVRDMVGGRNANYPVLLDMTGEALQAFNPASIPQNYFINGDGRLLSRTAGELTDMDFRAQVAQILRPDGQAFGSLQEEVRRVAQEVRCQECQGMSVWQSQAPSAWEMREEIERLFQEGLNRQEVLDSLVDHYGVWILMSPPREGRFLWVYIVPFLVIGAGGLLVQWLWARRRGRDEGEDGGPGDGGGDDVDPEIEAKIRRRLQEYL